MNCPSRTESCAANSNSCVPQIGANQNGLAEVRHNLSVRIAEDLGVGLSGELS